MKKFPFLIVLSLLLILLQQSVFSNVKIFGVTFNIVYVYIVCVSLMIDEFESFFIVLITGMIVDCFFPIAFGINTVIYLLTFLGCRSIQKRLYKDTMIVPMIMTFIYTLFKGIMIYSFLYLLSYKNNFYSMMVNKTLYEALYNSILSILIYKIILKIKSSKSLKEEWKF